MRQKKPATKSPPPRVIIDTPDFKSEAEEAQWWDDHREMVEDLLIKYGRRTVPTKTIAIRVPIQDIERAQALAQKRGIGYQTLIKALLHDALKREAGRKS